LDEKPNAKPVPGEASIRIEDPIKISRPLAIGRTEMIIDDDDRYAPLQLIGWWDQAKLRRSRILVVGAGALGNEVVKNLVLVGIGDILLIDFDTIQGSNLSRSVLFRAEDAGQSKSRVAARAARALNPDCRVIAIDGDVLLDIGLGTVRDVDLVICCVDNREARLWINRMCWKVGTPWIDGGIQEINGVAKVFMPPDGPCYECAMTERDYQLIQLRYSCPLLNQDDLQQGKVPTAPTIASIIGGLQAQEALKLIHELPTDTGAALVFNGVANRFYKSQFPLREDCLSHEHYDPAVELQLSARHSRVLDLKQAAHNAFSEPVESIELDRDLLIELTCQTCGTSRSVQKPRSSVSASSALCANCNQAMTPRSINVIGDDAYDQHTLRSIGIPDHDIVKITMRGGTRFVLLAEDRNAVFTDALDLIYRQSAVDLS
jgi:adenylyltransferase/sulfurtransferase